MIVFRVSILDKEKQGGHLMEGAMKLCPLSIRIALPFAILVVMVPAKANADRGGISRLVVVSTQKANEANEDEMNKAQAEKPPAGGQQTPPPSTNHQTLKRTSAVTPCAKPVRKDGSCPGSEGLAPR